MKKILPFLFLTFCTTISAQINCKAYQYYDDTLKYKACKKSEEARSYSQFSKEYQQIFDKVLEIDSTYDHAYWAKSIAYLKSGDFITWKILIDKAVELNPTNHLGYRGWCRYQFFRDYKGAILDIERFESIIEGDIGYCQNGDYHLIIAKAICYKAIGKSDKAIEIIEDYLFKNDNEADLFNLYHLGVLYFEKGDYKKALKYFHKQEKNNDLAENQYYIALSYKELYDYKNYKDYIKRSKKLYQEGYLMKDPYTHQYDKVYLSEIEEEFKRSSQ